jgi:hypothetical protein
LESPTLDLTNGASAPALRRAKMSWYNPDWYYTQPPEPKSEEEYEEDIYWAERKAKEEREDDPS